MVERAEELIPRYWVRVAAALFLLIGVDLLTTIYAAGVVGPGAEVNPLVRWALRRGIGTLVAINLAAVVVLVGFFYALVELLDRTDPAHRRSFATLIDVFLGLLVLAGLAVVANNTAVILVGASPG